MDKRYQGSKKAARRKSMLDRELKKAKRKLSQKELEKVINENDFGKAVKLMMGKT